ncbi:lipid A deacylase LpxR family protein [Psychroserpens sp. Hel_I_66]|uniref:lipid A deacylase LpxR family protein n=1 Tax=Psychroserpens sp. Hel_I_66 TaxID=1250004 RepID=UPI0006489C49|nr:lipid A deacylase LpxR family protein [Psychroserpens sp. Hel_I_66]
MSKTSRILIFFFLIFNLSNAQKIDNLISFRAIESESYFRFNYDNDYFAASDKNYTQGYSLEFGSPLFEKNPLNPILLKPENFKYKYGLAIEHIGFTPDDYELPEIQFGDRPFAAAIMLKSSLTAINSEKRLRVHSSLNLGLIGPGAFGEEMQVGIHKATGNKTPRGWRHQIKNDLVLNYNVGIEKQILEVDNLLTLQAQSNLNIGTLFTNLSVGSNLVLGRFHNSFSSEEKNKNFQIYTYAQPVVSVVGYDATLQGGLLNRQSPYTIASSDVERFTFQFNYGVVIQTKTLFFEYTRSTITKEFSTGDTAKWGGIRIGFTF